MGGLRGLVHDVGFSESTFPATRLLDNVQVEQVNDRMNRVCSALRRHIPTKLDMDDSKIYGQSEIQRGSSENKSGVGVVLVRTLHIVIISEVLSCHRF